jgi:cellulose synthase/poly-beta-1,6-N-acetylglucosamine synthase-like glycosyltransferase
MSIILIVILLFAVSQIAHSYLFFPVILKMLASGKNENEIIFQPDDADIPSISILLSVYNEAQVMDEKIRSVMDTSYPHNKIEFLIGSDASTDSTNEIIRSWQQKYPQIKLIEFSGRSGKSKIINELATLATGEIFILTDANVVFKPDTIYQLAKHYKNERIALVGGNIVNSRLSKDGISIQETSYISRENKIKFWEGKIWGTMIGAFGGCYSIRAGYYAPVPRNFFMDDFYITLNVIEKKGLSIFEPKASCYEDVSNKISEEFRRKMRISIGNFQNLGRYARLLYPPFSGVSFCFMSHKVLRWFGPFFLILALLSNIFLYGHGWVFNTTLIIQLVLITLPILDLILRKLKVHINLLRYITHFYLMNLALLVGFIKFLRGVETNIWQPTQRFQ